MTNDRIFAGLAARNSSCSSAEIENDIEAAIKETREKQADNYYPYESIHQRPDSRAAVLRLAALLLGLCLAAGAAAMTAAVGGGLVWALAVGGVLAAAFGLGIMAGGSEFRN